MNTVNLFNIIISEIDIAVSDLVLTIVCLHCYFHMRTTIGQYRPHYMYISCWTNFFLAQGASFFFGALGHGLAAYNVGDSFRVLSWSLGMLGMFVFLRGMIDIYYENVKKRFLVFLVFILVIFSAISAVFVNFYITVVYCFGVLFASIGYSVRKKIICFSHSHSKNIIIGAAFFVLSAMCYLFDTSYLWINASTVAHVMITIGVIIMCKGCVSYIVHHMEICAIDTMVKTSAS